MLFSKKKGSGETIHPLVLFFIILIIAVVLTWIIPSGQYTREKNAAGVSVVLPDQFSYTEKTAIHIWDIPKHVVKGFSDQQATIFMILFVGGAFSVLIKGGSIQGLLRGTIKAFGKKEWLFIPGMLLIIALIATTQSVQVFIPFTPIIVLMCRAMGYDTLLGASITLMGGAIGFSTGTLNPTSTLVAQNIAELPQFSGLEYRFVCFGIYWIVTSIILVRYARKIKAKPELSVMYKEDHDSTQESSSVNNLNMEEKMTVRHYISLAIFLVALGILVYGSVKLGWGMSEITMVFLWLAILVGFASGFSPSTIAKYFIEGAKGFMGTVMFIGVAKGVANIFSASGCMDTIVHGLSVGMNAMPNFLKGASMFWANLLINVPIVSASGQAGAVMPIFCPVGDLIGITRQTTVLAYNFGDGFCNYILPWSGALIGNISVVKIPYDKWMKFFIKTFLIWVALGTVLVMIAQYIHLGPF